MLGRRVAEEEDKEDEERGRGDDDRERLRLPRSAGDAGLDPGAAARQAPERVTCALPEGDEVSLIDEGRMSRRRARRRIQEGWVFSNFSEF